MSKIKAVIQMSTTVVIEYDTDEQVNRSSLYDKLHEDAGSFIEDHKDHQTLNEPTYSISEMHVLND